MFVLILNLISPKSLCDFQCLQLKQSMLLQFVQLAFVTQSREMTYMLAIMYVANLINCKFPRQPSVPFKILPFDPNLTTITHLVAEIRTIL